MISADTTIGKMYRLGLMTGSAKDVCLSGNIKTLAMLLKVDRYFLRRIKGCEKKTFGELIDIRERYNCYLQSYQNNTTENSNLPVEQIELLNAQKKIDLLSPISVLQLKGWITWKFNTLSVRAKNRFPQLCQLSSVIEIIYSTQKFNASDAKNIGKKTSGEIQSYLSEIKEHFEEITKEIEPNVDIPKHNEFDRHVAQLGELYPFLLSKECEMVATYMLTHNIVPILFIAKQYIFRSEDSRMRFFREYYGFNSEGRRYSLSEIGKRYNLSYERIRQLVSKKINLPKSIEAEIQRYLSPILENIIPFDSFLWSNIQRDNMLEESYSQTALLVCLLTNTHTIIQIDDNDKEYLVNKVLVENVRIRNVLSNIVRVITLRRTTIDSLDILAYIKEGKRVYHKDVNQLCCIYANYLTKNFKVDIEDNRYVMMLPNAMDVSIAIEDVLAQSGQPMTLKEIKQIFNTLYPSKPIDDVAKLKSYITRNPNIMPKGRTGIYILKSWPNHFTGTLKSYLEHILRTFKEPIPLDDLVDFALEEFPRSNKKSIYSLIVGDKDERFIIYEDDYIGIADTPISEIDLKKRRRIKRHDFETRFEDLKQFISTRKRLPTLIGFEEEKSLVRWINNILNSNIESTAEQLYSLKNYLVEHKELPQNGTEYNFKQMCDEIKVMVAKTFALPSASDNKKEYIWLRKNIDKYASYEDNRKTYFEDLLSYLKDFGFYL